MSSRDNGYEIPDETTSVTVAEGHGVTRGRSNVVDGKNQGERVRDGLREALTAWTDKRDPRALRRTLLHVLAVLDDGADEKKKEEPT